MLLLFETSAGYAIFKILNDKIIEEQNVFAHFKNSETANKLIKLKHFQKFKDTTEALAATTKILDGGIPKALRKAIKKSMDDSVPSDFLVADSKLGAAIREKFQLKCISNPNVQELMRCIRSQIDSLLAELPKKEISAMTLGLAHSLSRYKLKFSEDKIDTMVIQAICLLDDLEKELNNYVMRCREWYGWHFPELGKELNDNETFVKVVKIIGTRDNTINSDLSDILTEEKETKIKKLAETSMGTEISEDDIINIQNLCDQIINISNYKTQLSNYLDSRMLVIAPNLTVLVGTLVAARLISHAGSLTNLAKSPASTIQILGAEKSLFRALKTKKSTPKHGLIYHTSIIGQASLKNKGKMSRVLAAKMALTIRFDAFSEGNTNGEEDEEKKDKFKIGIEFKALLEQRLKMLEDRSLYKASGSGKVKARFDKYHVKSEVKRYPSALDSTMDEGPIKQETQDDNNTKVMMADEESGTSEPKQKKKKKKRMANDEMQDEIKAEVVEADEEPSTSEPKQKKKKKRMVDDETQGEIKAEVVEADEEGPPGKLAELTIDEELSTSERKQMKKKKRMADEEPSTIEPKKKKKKM